MSKLVSSWLNLAMCYTQFLLQNFNQIPSIMSRPAVITAVNSTSDINTEDKERIFFLMMMVLLAQQVACILLQSTRF